MVGRILGLQPERNGTLGGHSPWCGLRAEPLGGVSSQVPLILLLPKHHTEASSSCTMPDKEAVPDEKAVPGTEYPHRALLGRNPSRHHLSLLSAWSTVGKRLPVQCVGARLLPVSHDLLGAGTPGINPGGTGALLVSFLHIGGPGEGQLCNHA